jgi:hypothetical protein
VKSRCSPDKAARAVAFGLLAEMERTRSVLGASGVWSSSLGLLQVAPVDGLPPAPLQAVGVEPLGLIHVPHTDEVELLASFSQRLWPLATEGGSSVAPIVGPVRTRSLPDS